MPIPRVLLLTFVPLLLALPLAAQQQAPRVQFINPNPELNLPFSESVRVDDTIYLSGAIGTRPGTLELVPGGIQAETRQTMEHIRVALQRAGATMDDVVKCTVFLAEMAEWGAMNEVYVTFFPRHRPARSALGASGLALGARVEIECIAVIGARDAR